MSTTRIMRFKAILANNLRNVVPVEPGCISNTDRVRNLNAESMS
jgi:hypothetical protein